ncbi:hypothetical protein Prudu_017796, partial [Prunus dulcis]
FGWIELYPWVPVFCWSQLADQPVISRWVGRWKTRVDMKDKCDRSTVEKKMVRAFMEDRRDEILGSVSVKTVLGS